MNSKENRQRAVCFYQYLPPWRIDVFNAMGEMYDLTIVFANADCEGLSNIQGTFYRGRGALSPIKTTKYEK